MPQPLQRERHRVREHPHAIGSAVGLAVLVAIANAGVHTTTGPDLVPGLHTAGYTAAALTLLGVAIALTLRGPGSTPTHGATGAEQPAETGVSA
ncbi:hypothetical protein [Actinacidiphila yeochonensis]|uniref:hypothetical protein n=1 Tax=Actinacidiphila yeochonensis TaxID=89050 RepID=UPI00055A628B|nr:hypothetical protein [Actinacidiphila yeochonensis]